MTRPENLLFPSRMTTKIDVDMIIQKIGIPKEGDKITYEVIEDLIGLKKNSSRWRTVVYTWRKKLFVENNLVLKSLMNKGFLVLNPSERVSYADRKIVCGRNIILKAVNIVQATDLDNLDEETKTKYNFITSIPNRLRLATLVESKEMPY